MSNFYREPAIITYKEPMHKGPFRNCPACGIHLQYKQCSSCLNKYNATYNKCTNCSTSSFLSLNWWEGAPPKFCDSYNRFVIKKRFFKNIKCNVSGKHIHQSCYGCGWTGIADPESEDA